MDLIGNSLRYFIFAGIAYFAFWRWDTHRFHSAKIQQPFPPSGSIKTELKWSISTIFIFGFIGALIFTAAKQGRTTLYPKISDHGWGYFFISIASMLLVHDTYFYFTHRLMHHPKLFKHIHRIHHLSTNPTPWAAYSFHPLEAVIEAGIFPLMLFAIPVHLGAVIIFVLLDLMFNILGHLGYEFYPQGHTRHKFRGLSNSSTHHNMHHQYFNCNYGLYFNIWDQIFDTNHKKYHDRFEGICHRRNHHFFTWLTRRLARLLSISTAISGAEESVRHQRQDLHFKRGQ